MVHKTRQEDFQVLAGSASFLLASYAVGKCSCPSLAGDAAWGHWKGEASETLGSAG